MSLTGPPGRLSGWVGATSHAACGWVTGAGGEAGCLKSAGAFPLIQPRLGSAPGFWEGLCEPPHPAAGVGINAGRRG